MRKILACVATIALATSMAQAQPGKDKNNGGGKADHAAGPQAKGGQKHAEHGSARAMQASAEPAKQAKQDQRGNGNAKRADAKENRGTRPGQAAQNKSVRQDGGRKAEKIDRGQYQADRNVDRGSDRTWSDRDGMRRTAHIDFGDSRGLIDGCPPGLAKKNNGCTPPGLATQRDRSLRDLAFGGSYYRSDWWGYDGVGDRMFYDDGYLYRMGSQNNVLGFIPLLGGALSAGNIWPSYYDSAQVPDYYVDYYNLGPSGSYRYADDALFRVDPQTSAITAIAALLTGDQITVGQPMPRGYDVYNVPYAYRDRYSDSQDARYRYADGYVYQVDPTTQLVSAAIQLLT